MIIKSVWVSENNIEDAKTILSDIVKKLGKFSDLEMPPTLIDFQELESFSSCDFVKANAQYITQLLSFGFFVRKTEISEPVFSESPSIASNNMLKPDTGEKHTYILENRLASLMNSSFGSILVRLEIRKDILKELSLDENSMGIEGLSELIFKYVTPYWLSWNRCDEFTVCKESKPEMTAGEIANILIESGMTYMDGDTPDLILAEDISFISVESSPDFKTSIQKEIDISADALRCLDVDDFVRLSQLLRSGLSPNLNFPYLTLINKAFDARADNCIDVLLGNGASLWRVTSGKTCFQESNESAFLKIIIGGNLKSFAEIQFYMEYLKKEVLKSRESGKPIPYLVEKADKILFHLLLKHPFNKDFFEKWVIDSFKEFLTESEYNKVIVSVCVIFPRMLNYFKQSVLKMHKGDLLDILFANRSNLEVVYQIVKLRKIKSKDIVFEGKNIKQLVEHFAQDDQETLQKIVYFIK